MLALPRPPWHGFLASVTERHAVGRNMAPMGRRRSCCGCCWQAGSGPRTFITPGGIARVDRRVGQRLLGDGPAYREYRNLWGEPENADHPDQLAFLEHRDIENGPIAA